jgi:hypothetical protein
MTELVSLDMMNLAFSGRSSSTQESGCATVPGACSAPGMPHPLVLEIGHPALQRRI